MSTMAREDSNLENSEAPNSKYFAENLQLMEEANEKKKSHQAARTVYGLTGGLNNGQVVKGGIGMEFKQGA